MSVEATFVLLLLLLCAGKVLQRFVGDVAGDAGALVLNKLGIHLFFPAAILLHAPALQVSRALVGLVAIPWILLAAGAAAGACFFSFFFSRDRGVTTCVVLGLGFGNTAFLGYAVVPALLGDAALPYAVVYDQLGSFVSLSTVGVVAIAFAAGTARPSLTALGKKIATFPPFLALIVGVTVMPVSPPADVKRALEILAGALLPVMAVAVGLRLRFVLPAHQRLPLVLVVIGKLLLLPLLALGLTRAFALPAEVADVVVVQAAMPVMVTLAALLGEAKVVPELAAACVAFSTLGSMITLPLWGQLLKSGLNGP